jgi:hypothetical protein
MGIDVIDDLIVLGRCGIEELQDGRETICLGGWSDERGFVRLYPTQAKMKELSRWNVVRVPAIHEPSHDNRKESYKIYRSNADWDQLHTRIEKVGRLEKEERIRLVDRLPKRCSRELNNDRVSLGIMEPEEIKKVYTKTPEEAQVKFDRTSKKNHERVRIAFECVDCQLKTYHDKSCNEWGIYQFWKNNPQYDTNEVIDAMNLLNEDYKHLFFVGNLANQLTSYIIISVLRFKQSEWKSALGMRTKPVLENW